MKELKVKKQEMDTNILNEQALHGSYQDKLFDRRWLEKREFIINRDKGCCIICGSSENLIVHHKQYHYKKVSNMFIDPWDYDDKYLVTLCRSCHNRGHEKFEIPVKYI
jgi:5-methylcytosine-specific restriction endonuclease McrA